MIARIAWLLILGAAALLLVAPFIHERFSDALRGILPAGVLVALAAQLFARAERDSDRKEDRSKLYLERCLAALEGAKNLLSDRNNVRTSWIHAARALAHAQAFEREISVETHRHVLELEKIGYRRFFAEVLERPAAFYYGAQAWHTPLDEAAAESSSAEKLPDRELISSDRSIPEKALLAVWKATIVPDEWTDPLSEEFGSKEIDQTMVLYPGLYEYLCHKRRFHSAAGKLFERTLPNAC